MKNLLKSKIIQTIVKFCKGRFDCEPLDTKVFIQENIIIVRMKGILSRSEYELAKTEEGLKLVKELYNELFKESLPLLKSSMQEIVGINIKDIQTEVNPKTYECIQIFTFEKALNN